MNSSFFKTFAAAILVAPLLLTSCHDEFYDPIDGIGEVVESNLSLDSFDGIVNEINADIYLSQGENQDVDIQAQENIINEIELDVIGGKWIISYRHWVRNTKRIKIFITVPTLKSATISGSGNMIGETAFKNLDKLSLVISGSGNIEMETESDKLDILISGSGSFELSGSTKLVDARITGSGNINAYEVSTPKSDITITGSGNVFVSPIDLLIVRIFGSGSVHYRSHPDLNAQISGSGRVIYEP